MRAPLIILLAVEVRSLKNWERSRGRAWEVVRRIETTVVAREIRTMLEVSVIKNGDNEI